jgi:hypothetical protein
MGEVTHFRESVRTTAVAEPIWLATDIHPVFAAIFNATSPVFLECVPQGAAGKPRRAMRTRLPTAEWDAASPRARAVRRREALALRVRSLPACRLRSRSTSRRARRLGPSKEEAP